jgi:hypothetical protein
VTAVDLHHAGRFYQKLAVQSTAISLTEQLKSQLPRAQQLVTRRLVRSKATADR